MAFLLGKLAFVVLRPSNLLLLLALLGVLGLAGRRRWGRGWSPRAAAMALCTLLPVGAGWRSPWRTASRAQPGTPNGSTGSLCSAAAWTGS